LTFVVVVAVLAKMAPH